MKRRPGGRIVLGLIVLAAAVAVAATRVGFLQGPAPGPARSTPAPEFRGISTWLNSPPLTITSLQGRTVLIDFWTYSCINCIRTFPALRRLYARYNPFGLELVGVHSPEFNFEKVESNVRAAIRRYSLPWPVAMDNDMMTWDAYRNHYWPHVYLIDAHGKIRFDKVGEGGDEEIQANIRRLLGESRAKLPAPIDFTETSFAPNLTPEVYAGYERGTGNIGNHERYRPGVVVDYAPPDRALVQEAGTQGTFFLEGRWFAEAEFIRAEADGARIVLPFYAKDVFFVGASRAGPLQVELLLDDKPPAANVLGEDAPGGMIRVGGSDLFGAIHLATPSAHRLTLIVPKGFLLYTFTFG